MILDRLSKTALKSMRVAINTQAQSDALKAIAAVAALLRYLATRVRTHELALTDTATNMIRSQTTAEARFEMKRASDVLKSLPKTITQKRIIGAIKQSMIVFQYIKG